MFFPLLRHPTLSIKFKTLSIPTHPYLSVTRLDNDQGPGEKNIVNINASDQQSKRLEGA